MILPTLSNQRFLKCLAFECEIWPRETGNLLVLNFSVEGSVISEHPRGRIADGEVDYNTVLLAVVFPNR